MKQPGQKVGVGLSRGAVMAAHDFLFLKISCAVTILVLGVYAWHNPAGGPKGDTWLGYTLGIGSALVVCWLAYFGIRKRRYAAGSVDLRTWLAAHIYLGVLVIIVATLHSGFRLGLNLHGLAWLLLVLTCISGVFGLQAYIRYPRLMVANRGGIAFDALLGQIADADREMQATAMPMGDDLSQSVHAAIIGTTLSGTAWQRLSGRFAACPTARMRQKVEIMLRSPSVDEVPALRQLLAQVIRKEALLARVRRELQLLAWLQVWLFFHIPLSCALLAAITAHVTAVMFFL